MEECYPSQDESDETSDRKLNKSSSIEDLLNDSERTSYNLTITSNNDEISSNIGKIDGHLKRNCGLELTSNNNNNKLIFYNNL